MRRVMMVEMIDMFDYRFDPPVLWTPRNFSFSGLFQLKVARGRTTNPHNIKEETRADTDGYKIKVTD